MGTAHRPIPATGAASGSGTHLAKIFSSVMGRSHLLPQHCRTRRHRAPERQADEGG
jgi:hypothetical protein